MLWHLIMCVIFLIWLAEYIGLRLQLRDAKCDKIEIQSNLNWMREQRDLMYNYNATLKSTIARVKEITNEGN